VSPSVVRPSARCSRFAAPPGVANTLQDPSPARQAKSENTSRPPSGGPRKPTRGRSFGRVKPSGHPPSPGAVQGVPWRPRCRPPVPHRTVHRRGQPEAWRASSGHGRTPLPGGGMVGGRAGARSRRGHPGGKRGRYRVRGQPVGCGRQGRGQAYTGQGGATTAPTPPRPPSGPI
jgi:hypothetical protein